MDEKNLEVIVNKLNEALNEHQIAKNKAYDQYMTRLEQIFMEHCFIDDGPMSDEQVKSVDDALAYVLDLQKSGLLPSVINTEIDRKKEMLLSHIMQNREQVNKTMGLQ